MRFLGNKESIVMQIRGLMSRKSLLNRGLVLFDAFCGAGSVSDELKDCFDLIVNDIMSWSVLYTKGRIYSVSCTFEHLGFDPFEYLNASVRKRHGFIYNNYSPGGSNRMYFTAENAARIDYFRWQIEDWFVNEEISDEEYACLIASLVEAVSSVSNTAGVYGAFLKKWDGRALKKIKMRPVSAKQCRCRAVKTTHEKIEDIIEHMPCDVLYLDPPYTQNQYGTQYHLLETLVLDDAPQISPITGSRSTSPYRSDWSKNHKAHILFDKVIAKTKAQHIVVSYSNDGILSKDYIEAVLKRYGKPETLVCEKIDYKQYLNWKANEDSTHLEYIFYVEKKDLNDVVYEAPLNYIGSKAKMVAEIKRHLPNKIERAFDVFGGGFNVGINLPASHVFYNDSNFFVTRLIESFRRVDTYEYLSYLKKVIQKYGLRAGDKEAFLVARKTYNGKPLTKRDIKFLYVLILYGFQQQIRFNSDHDFNNPPGNRWFNDCVLEKFVSFSRRIKELYCTFTQNDFQRTLQIMRNGDFVYIDPPYRLTCGAYNDGKRGFGGWTKPHEDCLFEYMDELDKMGVRFLFSYVQGNEEEHNENLELWLRSRSYHLIQVGEAQGRYGKRKEILVKNYE